MTRKYLEHFLPRDCTCIVRLAMEEGFQCMYMVELDLTQELYLSKGVNRCCTC